MAALALQRFDDVEHLRGVFLVRHQLAEMAPGLERPDAAGLAVGMDKRTFDKCHAKLHCSAQLTIV